MKMKQCPMKMKQCPMQTNNEDEDKVEKISEKSSSEVEELDTTQTKM